jgi:hypothetical protein
LPWPRLAERFGVTVRTLDRWVQLGIIAKPEVIRGRKYGDPDCQPRLDAPTAKGRAKKTATAEAAEAAPPTAA